MTDAQRHDFEQYTIFSSREKIWIVALLGAAMLTSPLTATMYLPLLPLLSAHFHTSAQAINLTITVYIIFQALSPVFLASTSDYFGRRPIYLATFALYTAASLGLALNKSSYAALLILRALQSLGASAVLSVSYGTISDIAVPAVRGKMLGPMLAAGNVGTCVGPIVGGGIALASGSFEWAFWALFVFGGAMLLALTLFIPETARNVVGNGSVEDKKWNQPIWKLLRRWSKNLPAGTNPPQSTSTSGSSRAFKTSSPLASLRIIFYGDTCLVIWIPSSFYALWYCVQASIPSTYKAACYSFTDLEVGLAYLPGSVGVILSMYLAGKFMDRSYKITAKRMGFAVDKVKGDDLATFPIEQARSRGCTYLLLISTCVMLGYGWAIERGVHVSIPLILQFFQGFLATWLIQCFSALLVDSEYRHSSKRSVSETHSKAFPRTPSTAATAGNMMRCVLSAVAVALLQPLIAAIGKGWFFTLIGLLTGFGGLGAHLALRRWGMKWRRRRNKDDSPDNVGNGEGRLVPKIRSCKEADTNSLGEPSHMTVVSEHSKTGS